MATGGGFPRLKQSKSETKQRSSNWPRSVSSDKDDSLSLTSFPSDIRINNWDLSDLRPTASADSRRRKKSKGNPEREREQSLSMDSPPHGEPKQRTPTSLSRTRNTPTAQRDALEKLKQKLTYEEEQYSTDGERNNERSQARGRRRQANNREAEGASGGGGGSRRPRINRNNNTEQGVSTLRYKSPDRNQIVGRLVQIQDYIKQAASMMETLQKSGDTGNAEDLAKVGRLISNLQEQEQGYLSLLRTNAAQRGEVTEQGTDGLPSEGATKDDSDSEDVDLEVETNASETSETSSSSRPRIEDKLGADSEDEKESDDDDDSKDEDTAMDNTMVDPVSAASQAHAMRSVAETLNSLAVERDGEAPGGSDMSMAQRQQLMRVMMEKQEQLRQLQSRQEQLLTMKREAETRLQQAQSRDNQARAALAQVEAGQVALEDEGAFLEQAEVQLKSNIVPYPESDDDETSNAREADPLSELQRQLNFLRNEFSAETGLRPRNNTECSSGGGSVSGGGAATVTGLGQQQKQLQDKLMDLQQKKHSMDHLLAQLETLRSQRLHVMNNEPSTGRPQLSPQQQQLPPPPPPPPTTSSAPPQQQQQQQTSRAMEPDLNAMLARLGGIGGLSGLGGTSGLGGIGGLEGLGGLMGVSGLGGLEGLGGFGGQLALPGLGGLGGGGGEGGGLSGWQTAAEQGEAAEGSLGMQEAQEKLEKLQEVRQRLNQLRDLVQYYQKMKTVPGTEDAAIEDDQSDTAEQAVMPGIHAMEETLRGLPLSVLGAGASMSSMGSAPMQPAEGAFLQLQGALASVASDEQSDEDNASASEDWESGMGPWDRDPEVQEKVRKLMKAKDKLRDLQGLIAAIESMPDGEKMADIAQSGAPAQRPARGPQGRAIEAAPAEDGMGEAGNASVSDGEIPSALSLDPQMNPRDDPRVQQQIEELTRLREERQRLLDLQQQLHTLQNRFVEAERESEGESRTEDSSRKGEGMQPPSTSVVTFASNDELYSKMRDQRIEREELRSKKKELEAIMKKDQNRRQYFRNQDNQSDTVSYTTGTDAFGANASVDATMATWGGSTVDNLENITEDEDGQDTNTRPEDEEDGYPSDGIVQVEEEEEENETDNGTYTVSNDARNHSGSQPSKGQGQGARPKTSRGRRGFPQPVRPAGGKKGGKRLQSQPWGRVSREERLQHRQAAAAASEEEPAQREFRQQLEKMSSLCQNLMTSPASSRGRSQSKTRAQIATRSSADAATSPPDMQNQLMREMQQQQLMLAVSQCNQQLMMQQFDMAALHRQLQQLTGQMSSMQQSGAANPAGPHHPQAQPGVLMPQPYLSPLSSTLAAAVPNVATSVNVQSSRQTTFTVNPNFTSNPFSADPQRFPVSQGVQTSVLDPLSADTGQGGWTEGGAGSTFPRPMRLWEDAREPGDRRLQSQTSETLPKMNLQAFLKARRKKNVRKQSEKSPPKPSDRERGAAYRPGLSAGISGAGFNDAASMSSLASSQVEGAVGGQGSQAEDPGALGELNLFEELRETIYTEVATLISQNESRPQYLLDLFTQLQCLNTDVMRRRCLFTLQDIIQTTYVKPVPATVSETRFMKMWQPRDDQDNMATELTPSESLLTSDEEEMKARVRQHASALERKKQKQRSFGAARGNSLKNDKFDYVETALTGTSSLSTPTNDNGESPFSRDSLGDTVIHLDKALAKMRREMQQAEQERAERARNTVAMEMRQEVSADAAMGDQGSESSVSDLPYPSIDALKLDEQIKGVMAQVIPVIKEHINDVFSPQLLSYIQRLVLSLVRQPGQNHEFARFFYGQLASILQDSLSKFEGRRVREVGEDVLLDMSEVLFNELAFLRIMRDLDNPVAMEKIRKHSWFSQPRGSQRTSAAMVGEDYDAGGNESDNEASDDKDDDDTTPKNIKVDGMDEEEEELGKERDDELARKTVTQTGEEKDEDMEAPHTTSNVQIQLAMSETKPFTRIGSDEDTDGSDESLSLEDPSDTAVSRSTMMEHRQDTANIGAAAAAAAAIVQAGNGSATSPQPQKEATTEKEEEKEADTSEADGTLDTRGQADGSRENSNTAAAAPADTNDVDSGETAVEGDTGGEEKGAGERMEVQMNGHDASPEEEEEETAIGVDDLPPVLNVSNPESVEQKRQEEEIATTGVSGIINSMDTGDELAGDGSALRDPDSAGK